MHLASMLEKSVGLDPSFAPAWYELSRRYYVASRYADAGHDTVERYEIAAVRAVSLDPNYIAAAAFLANSYVERGELIKAYQQDEDLVRRRPDSFQAHFSRSYVLRYAGLLKESANECEISLSLAPNDVPRSCAIVFSLQGDYERAMDTKLPQAAKAGIPAKSKPVSSAIHKSLDRFMLSSPCDLEGDRSR